MTKADNYRYQVGGSLPTDASTYVVREADRTLFDALVARDYCYLLDARQMGKSSLRARTMRRLRERGIVSAEIELSGIGSQEITARQWYGGIIWELASGFSLAVNRRQWLWEHDTLSPVQRLGMFIETVLLTQITQPIVIFFDEIDHVLGLDFPTDDFFALIRHCYEKRAADTRYRRLSIVLLGAASPSNLIHNRLQSTPFNIGRAISLQGFKPHEVGPLVGGFTRDVKDPADLLNIILDWTGGQPFLTQKICSLVRQQLDERRVEDPDAAGKLLPLEELSAFVADLVQIYVIDQWEVQDEPEHLRTICDRTLQPSPFTQQRLRLYQRILTHGRVRVRRQPEHLELHLTGLVKQQNGHWVVKNPIYRAIFTPAWVARALQDLSPARPSHPLPEAAIHGTTPSRYAWIVLAIISALISGSLWGLRTVGVLQPWELKAFDYLMQRRPPELPDPRVLIIEITETDVQSQQVAERGASSLSDRVLDQLRRKLERAQPRAIGLDIYREQAVAPIYSQLAQWMGASDRFFAICNYGNPGVPPPPEAPLERHGFNNVIEDSDGVLRRYPLAVGNPSPCDNAYALSWLLAARYLEAEGITAQITPAGYLQLGNTVFKPLMPRTGGYQSIDASGHQVMINYRSTSAVAKSITLGEFLSHDTEAQIARDRIVIIGTSAPSFNDHRWLTPHSQQTRNLVPLSGIEVQAHLVSQLLSATLDQRPLIWTWPAVIDNLWIMGWAITGGLIARYGRTLRVWILALGITFTILLGICLQLLLMGGWVPLAPAAMALLTCSCSMRLILQRKTSVTYKVKP